MWTIVILVLLATELTMRSTLTHLSQDLVHIEQIPDRIEKLSAGREPRILFLGNSITREGIDISTLEAILDSQNPVTVAEVYPDDTSITEWLYSYLHFVDLPKKKVELLVICFAEDQLQDRPSIDVRRLAYNYSDWSTAVSTLREEKMNLDQSIEFFLGRMWSTFANAERVQKRIMDLIVPYYRSTARRINNAFAPTTGNVQTSSPSPSPTFRRLSKLISILESQNVDLMVFALPVAKSYEISSDLKKVLRDSEIPLFDVRQVAGITPANFPDGYHMDESAAQLMTRAVSIPVTSWLKQRE